METFAEFVYKKTLREIERRIGREETYSGQLHRFGKKYIGPKFTGVYPVDRVPRKFTYAIVNLDKSDMPGSHWIGVVSGKKNIYIYDSFGRSSRKIVPILFKKKGKGIKIIDSDRDAEQKKKEENCGQRALSWLFIFEYFGKKLAMEI